MFRWTAYFNVCNMHITSFGPCIYRLFSNYLLTAFIWTHSRTLRRERMAILNYHLHGENEKRRERDTDASVAWLGCNTWSNFRPEVQRGMMSRNYCAVRRQRTLLHCNNGCRIVCAVLRVPPEMENGEIDDITTACRTYDQMCLRGFWGGVPHM